MDTENFELLRHIQFVPYIDGLPTFVLKMYDTGKTDNRGTAHFGGRSVLAYEFFQCEPETDKETLVLSGDEWCPSPMCSIDGNDSVRGLMGFICLKPGDTDDEYFENYNEDQLEFANNHGEMLSLFSMDMEDYEDSENEDPYEDGVSVIDLIEW